MQLWPHQQYAIDELKRLISSGARRICVQAATGAGKCFGRGTRILLYRGGYKNAENVTVGDILMGPDSTPRTVVGTHSGVDQLYRVKQTRAASYVVNGKHVLCLRMTKFNRGCVSGYSSGEELEMSVDDYLQQSKTFKHCAKGYRTGVEYPHRNIPLDPYFLGLWLGDGTTTLPSITTPDVEVVDEIYRMATHYGLRVTVQQKPFNKSSTYTIVGSRTKYVNPLTRDMRQLGVIGDKHIPVLYLENSREVRLALLAGIIDSDGHKSKNCTYDLVFKPEQLANDVTFLARSLGFKVTLTPCRKTCANNGVTGDYFRISLTGDIDQVPMRIPRKQTGARQQKKDHCVSGVKVEPIGTGEYFGFEVDGDHKFLIEDFTVAHNSHIMRTHMEQFQVPTALYTDRKMLMAQLGRGLDADGFLYGVRAAGVEPRLLEDIQLCMVQTEYSRAVNKGRDIHRADHTIWDEAHRFNNPTAAALRELHLKRNPNVVEIGFTATPLGLGGVYDEMIVAGTNSELRDCGALVPAYHYAPDEPDTKLVGRVTVGEGECGIPNAKRMQYATRVFGSVEKHYWQYNPEQKPTILFAPGVRESLWFAQTLSGNGISTAHIDGKNIWVDGETFDTTDDKRQEISERLRDGDIKIVSNRFVMREGVDLPFLEFAILATIFGSLTSYIQAGGRVLRASPSTGKEFATIIDHGGNHWRHGSLNANREWKLEYTDRIVAGLREDRIRKGEEPEPITCPECNAVRLSGPMCPVCKFRYEGKVRKVLQADGSLREMKGDIFRKRRHLTYSEKLERDWCSRVKAVKNSKKEHVRNMTFTQLEVAFARDHNWQYPPRELPMMPVNEIDWYLPVSAVKELT